MLDTVRNFLFGPPCSSGLEAQDASRETLEKETKASYLVDLFTGCLSKLMVVGSETQVRDKVFLSSTIAFCCGQISKAERFRLEARFNFLTDNKKCIMRYFVRGVSFGLESIRNVFLGANNVVSFEKQFGEGMAQFTRMGVNRFYPVEGALGKVIPTLAIGSAGFSLAALLDKNNPEMSRALRVISVAHAIYGIFPERIGLIAENIVNINYGIFSYNEYLFTLFLVATIYSDISADDRRGLHTPATLV